MKRASWLPARLRRHGSLPWLVLVAVAAVLMLASLASIRSSSAPSPEARSATAALPEVAPPNLLRPISPVEAVAENAQRAFTGRPDDPAQPFVLKADAASKERALECMTQAIYYEAGYEPEPGKLAVAQVILNRVRHPGYPSTVCGVVYQGSKQSTGCQFTFTCDGSLMRAPAQSGWTAARKIAAQALAGLVSGAVGHATHYHADFVLPYWADSLDKQRQIGHHIFYRLRGSLGSAAAFSQRYGGREPIPTSPVAVEVALDAINQVAVDLSLPGPQGTVLETGRPQPLEADKLRGNPLVADERRGSLISGGSLVPPAATRANSGCAVSDAAVKTAPVKANDLRSTGKSRVC